LDTLYILDLRTLSIWPSFGDDPLQFPSAGRVQTYLENHGVIFSPEGGVQVMTNGQVYVTSVNDPTAAWNTFNNEPTPDESLLEQRLVQALAIRNKLAAGTATAAEKDAGLRLALTFILRQYSRD